MQNNIQKVDLVSGFKTYLDSSGVEISNLCIENEKNGTVMSFNDDKYSIILLFRPDNGFIDIVMQTEYETDLKRVNELNLNISGMTFAYDSDKILIAKALVNPHNNIQELIDCFVFVLYSLAQEVKDG